MARTIEYFPEIERRLEEVAQQGIDTDAFVNEAVEEKLRHMAAAADEVAIPPQPKLSNGTNHFYFTASQEEWERAFDELSEANEKLPVLPPEAFERESIYED